MIEDVRKFLELFTGEPASAERRLRLLAERLDRLAVVYHEVIKSDWTSSSDDVDIPWDYNDQRLVVVKYFPDFGFYPAIDSQEEIGGTSVAEDAIDDLVDIRHELERTVRRWEHVSRAEAEAYFKYSYELHWWRHLQALRGYVLARIMP